MDKHSLSNSLRLLKQHYFFKLFGWKPSEKYKPLDAETLATCEAVVDKYKGQIWNKEFWGLSQKDSIASVAGPIEAELATINKLKKDLGIK